MRKLLKDAAAPGSFVPKRVEPSQPGGCELHDACALVRGCELVTTSLSAAHWLTSSPVACLVMPARRASSDTRVPPDCGSMRRGRCAPAGVPTGIWAPELGTQSAIRRCSTGGRHCRAANGRRDPCGERSRLPHSVSLGIWSNSPQAGPAVRFVRVGILTTAEDLKLAARAFNNDVAKLSCCAGLPPMQEQCSRLERHD